MKDELLWGAAWLQKATRNPMYLQYIQVNGQELGADETDNTFGWDNKHVGARILLSKVIFDISITCFFSLNMLYRVLVSTKILALGPIFRHF